MVITVEFCRPFFWFFVPFEVAVLSVRRFIASGYLLDIFKMFLKSVGGVKSFKRYNYSVISWWLVLLDEGIWSRCACRNSPTCRMSLTYFRHLKLYRTHFATGGFKYNYFFAYVLFLLVCLVVFNATFSNMSVISWWSVLLAEETGWPIKKHRIVASHWQTLSHNVVHFTLIEIRTHNISGSSPLSHR